VSTIPERLQRIVGLREDSPTHPSLTWSAKAYVCHIADNLRIWAERLEAGLRGDGGQLASYDDNLLAVARGYEQVSWRVAWVALEWSVSTWVETAEHALEGGLTLHHPDRGPLTAADVIATNCHDASHHLWDVSRIVEHAGRLQTE
jgi:hypothetical protein